MTDVHTYFYIVVCTQQGCRTLKKNYNKQFLSIKSGCYNKHRCYNEHGGILSANVACTCTWCVRPSHFD